ncbi:MAG TPA: hypothetical protein VLT16_05235 [Candidatus Limnocylindrales bacterium]|nr:hypothetical protein [Candidatus Limnocylindrales bacterium]
MPGSKQREAVERRAERAFFLLLAIFVLAGIATGIIVALARP